MEHGLVDRKGNYDYMFSINTRSRSYFLAVDSRREMDTWVNMVCKACGLKENADETEIENSVSHPPSLHNGEFLTMTMSCPLAVIVNSFLPKGMKLVWQYTMCPWPWYFQH